MKWFALVTILLSPVIARADADGDVALGFGAASFVGSAVAGTFSTPEASFGASAGRAIALELFNLPATWCLTGPAGERSSHGPGASLLILPGMIASPLGPGAAALVSKVADDGATKRARGFGYAMLTTIFTNVAMIHLLKALDYELNSRRGVGLILVANALSSFAATTMYSYTAGYERENAAPL